MNATEFPASDDLRAIRYRFDGPVAIVELHRPHRANAWNGTMHGEFLAVMRHIETLDDVRTVVVTGTPPAFSVGATRKPSVTTPNAALMTPALRTMLFVRGDNFAKNLMRISHGCLAIGFQLSLR